MAEFANPPGVWAPFGAFSMAALPGNGQIVHIKGQVSLNAAGKLVARGDMAGQVRKVLENIRTVLESFGGGMADIVSLTHYTVDIDGFMAAGPIRAEFFSPPYPVTTTVEVVRLYDPDLLIEISGIAEVPLHRFRRPNA